MKFAQPVVEARFLRREKRFFSFCQLPDGSEVVAHCPNSGAMRGNKEEGSPVWLLDFGADHAATGRKLRYKHTLIESQGVKVVIDTLAANLIVGEALREGRIPELLGWGEAVAEKKVGASRLDFYLPGPPETYVEVKSVSMGEGTAGAFPDAVTDRGLKHIRELMALRAAGKRAVLFFLATREGCLTVRPADEIDPAYAHALRQAVASGLEVLVYGIEFSPQGYTLGKKGSLELS